MNIFFENLSYSYFQYAIIGAILLGLTAPLIGVFVIQKNLSFASDSLGHIGIAAVGIGLATNSSPLIVSLIIVILGSLIIYEVQKRLSTSGDFALAVVSFTGIATGLIFSAKSSNSGNFESYLFGSLLTITKNELIIIIILCCVLALFVYFFNNALFSINIDETSASVSGIPVGVINRLFYIALSIVILIGLKTIGVLLIGALLVIPAGTSTVVAKSLKRSLLFASLFGVVAAVGGMFVASWFNTIPGATIVVFSTVQLLVVKIAKLRS